MTSIENSKQNWRFRMIDREKDNVKGKGRDKKKKTK